MNIDESTITEGKEGHLLSGWRFSALIFTIAATMVGYFFFSLWGDWNKVVSAFYDIGLFQLLFSLAISCVGYIFRFLRWNYFLVSLGHRVPIMRNLRIYISGFSLTATPGKAGEALRSVFLADEGIAYRRSFGALIAERLSDIISVILLAAGGLAFLPATRPILLISLLFIATLLYAVQKDRWLKKIEKWANRRFENRFAHHVEFFIETIIAFRSCFKIHVLLVGTLLGMIGWGLEGAILYNLLNIQGIQLPLYTAIFIHAFSLLLGALSFLPGGLGAAEATTYQLLTYFGTPTAIAVSTTLILRLSTLWFSVFLGILFLPKRKIGHGSNEGNN